MSVLLILMQVDPRLVRPGLAPLLIILGLFVALGLLFLSLRRQIRKINLPYRDEIDEVEEPAQDQALDQTHAESRPEDDRRPDAT